MDKKTLEYIDWATELILAAVEIMTPEQVGKWMGVRAWLETREDYMGKTNPTKITVEDEYVCPNCGMQLRVRFQRSLML